MVCCDFKGIFLKATRQMGVKVSYREVDDCR